MDEQPPLPFEIESAEDLLDLKSPSEADEKQLQAPPELDEKKLSSGEHKKITSTRKEARETFGGEEYSGVGIA